MSIVTRKFDFGGLDVNVVKEGDDIWFKGRDVALALGYKRPSDAISIHVDNKDKRMRWKLGFPGGHPNTIFINESGMKRLVLKSRMPNAQDIAEALGMDIYNSKVLYEEQESISAIQKAFDSERMITQYAVGEYRIDLYFPKHHVAVECDEHGHADRDEDKETERQEYIENKLDCRFVRFNPDRKNFCIFGVINNIRVAMQVRRLRK